MSGVKQGHASDAPSPDSDAVDVTNGTISPITDADNIRLAELGHVAQLKRQYGLVSVIAIGCIASNSWSGLAGTLVTGVYSGGPSLILYGYIFVTIANAFVALSLAELASSYPTAGGPYHWAAVIAPKRWSRVASFLTGYLNLFAWIVGTAGSVLMLAQYVIAMAILMNVNFAFERWMIFVLYEAWAIISTVYSIYGNALMPHVIRFALFWSIASCFITIIVMAALSQPKQSATAVFATWINKTGWTSNGITACIGLINPAFGYAAIDATIHYSEEVKDPERNVPLSLLAVLGIGFVSGFAFLVNAFFSVSDYDGILASSTGLPVVEMYRQAAGTAGGLGLTLLIFFATIPSLLDCQVATGRLLWALARDNAMPFSSSLKKVNTSTGVPVQASITIGVCLSLLGCIYIGNTTAFSAFISSGLVLNNLTYATPVLVNMLCGRKDFRRGKFHMGGITGWVSNGLMICWVLFTLVFFEFPTFYPVTAANMNYTCLILGACLILAGTYWTLRAHKSYHGPVVEIHIDVVASGNAGEKKK